MNNLNNIDEEWKNFITTSNSEYYSDEEYDYDDAKLNNVDIGNENIVSSNLFEEIDLQNISENDIPKSSNIYISTKTKIAFLSQPINLKEMFWIIPVLQYMEPKNGVIKKQIKFNCSTEEELQDIQNRLQHENHYDEQIITSIKNPNGRIKFKDIRKITIGLSKKDIMSYRSKKKSAFYNCFVLILRMKVESIFKEFHVKVFNTGKMEIPGIVHYQDLEKVKQIVLDILQPYVSEKLCFLENSNEDHVLINSNFNCGFFILSFKGWLLYVTIRL